MAPMWTSAYKGNNVERSQVFFDIYGPFYQGQPAIFDFQTGNAAGMHAASAVEIKGRGGIQAGAVCVTGDEA